MTDIRLVQKGSDYEAVTIDWLVQSTGELDTSGELATAVIVALCSDRRADASDVLPNPDSDDRRGWWADTDAETIWSGWPIGSRLWLLSREKVTGAGASVGSLTGRIEIYLHEALQPMIDRGIATSKTVTVTRVGNERVDAAVTLFRGDKSEVELRFATLWDGVRA